MQIQIGEMVKRLKGEEGREDKGSILLPFSLFAFSPFAPVFSAISVVSYVFLFFPRALLSNLDSQPICPVIQAFSGPARNPKNGQLGVDL